MLRVRCFKIRQIIRPFMMQKRMKSALSRSWFQFLFHENLLMTNSLTSGFFMAIGDLIIQEIEFRNGLLSEKYNWARATQMLIVGGMLGPMHHYYYIKLDKLIPKVNLKTVFIKIAADQFVCAPLTILFFFFGMGVLENKPLQEISDEIKLKFKYVYMGDCIFWPPVQFINFYYLPTPYRVVYINLATLIFDVYLAYIKHYDSVDTNNKDETK
ncbi:PXMP2/4 family protein 4-like isoform X2 [Hyposmocoma kahamanoa]|nr:PXMP2/4 family protein 4-like isoform X2 [Hyposmocoma kahamanoa]